jgi:hypothetical protein
VELGAAMAQLKQSEDAKPRLKDFGPRQEQFNGFLFGGKLKEARTVLIDAQKDRKRADLSYQMHRLRATEDQQKLLGARFNTYQDDFDESIKHDLSRAEEVLGNAQKEMRLRRKMRALEGTAPPMTKIAYRKAAFEERLAADDVTAGRRDPEASCRSERVGGP